MYSSILACRQEWKAKVWVIACTLRPYLHRNKHAGSNLRVQVNCMAAGEACYQGVGFPVHVPCILCMPEAVREHSKHGERDRVIMMCDTRASV